MKRLAIVTGTSRGLGAAVAWILLDRGWEVRGVARGDPPDELRHEAYSHAYLDLADLQSVRRWFEAALERDPGMADVSRVGLINNAGVLQPVAPLHRVALEDLSRATLVNAVVPTWLAGRVVARFRDVPVRIIDVSSGAATSPYPGWGAYCASKAALLMSGRVLATELEETPELLGRDVAVVSYAPHVVDTSMQAEVRASDPSAFPRRARFEALHYKGELVPPEGPAAEIADLLEADGLPTHSIRRYEP